jgi:hypothetical protein
LNSKTAGFLAAKFIGPEVGCQRSGNFLDSRRRESATWFPYFLIQISDCQRFRISKFPLKRQTAFAIIQRAKHRVFARSTGGTAQDFAARDLHGKRPSARPPGFPLRPSRGTRQRGPFCD